MVSVWKIIGKLGFLMVIIGFFMPVSCSQNGFQIADLLLKTGSGGEAALVGIAMYVLFAAALLGLLVGSFLIIRKKNSRVFDWVFLVLSMGPGAYVYFKMLRHIDALQTGAYVILAGWLLSLVAQLVDAVPVRRARRRK